MLAPNFSSSLDASTLPIFAASSNAGGAFYIVIMNVVEGIKIFIINLIILFRCNSCIEDGINTFGLEMFGSAPFSIRADMTFVWSYMTAI